MKKVLRHGYTTGACAAAAVKGAARMLRDRQMLEEVEITLPIGETVKFHLYGQKIAENAASCHVVKDAGDDPDVTNGAEIHATVTLTPTSPTFTKDGDENRVVIEGGAGIGRVTKPGLAVAVGEWAINPVPRRMIADAVREVFGMRPSAFAIHCLISIPDGEERAKKTLNARLGIVGGLSILGTTGIVKPISSKAWTDTIDAAIDVALASGCGTVVLSTGRTSEMVAQKCAETGDWGLWTVTSGAGGRETGNVEGLKEEAFVMMGDYVGYALQSCSRKGVQRLVLAGQFAKLLKIACGHEQTHVLSSDLDMRMLLEWLQHETLNSKLETIVRQANTARHLLESSGKDPGLIELVCGRAWRFAQGLAPGVAVKVLLAGHHGEMLYFA